MARKESKDTGISQRKGRTGWWVRITHNGRERLHKCDTKSQAKALYGRLKAEIREETYFPEKFKPSNEVTLRAWIQRYLDGCSSRGVLNEQRYGKFWSKHFGTRLLTDLTTEDLRRFQARLKTKWDQAIEDRKNKGTAKKANAPSTVNRYFAFLRHVLTLAVKDGKLNRNPMGGVTFFPEEKRTRFLTDAELKRLKSVLDPQDWPAVAFAIETCLRQDEQFSLKWAQVDLEHSVVTLPMPKGGKTRHVPLSEGAKTILRSLGSLLESPWVFQSPVDPLVHRNAGAFYRRVFKSALRKAGIVGATWHTLRHTGASRRVQVGVALYAVQKILGHASIKTTERYAHLSPGHLQDAINRGSLETVTKTVTKQVSQSEQRTEAVERLVELAGIEPATFRLPV